MTKDMYPLFFCFFWGGCIIPNMLVKMMFPYLHSHMHLILLILFLTTQLSPILAEKKGKKFVIKTMLSYFRTISVV